MLQKISRWLQYLYFLRFCILTWLFIPVLLLLDLAGKTTSITRGIFTLENGWQAYNAAFFILALNMTVLITARNIVRNGPDRFSSDPPPSLKDALCSTTSRAMWITLLVVHLPTILTVCWLYHLARPESIPYLWLLQLAGLAAGFSSRSFITGPIDPTRRVSIPPPSSFPNVPTASSAESAAFTRLPSPKPSRTASILS